MADSTDEDVVRFAKSQQIGILESEGESLGGRQVDVGGVSVGAEASLTVDVPCATEQSAVSRAVDAICSGVELPPDDHLVIVEERSEVQLEGELGDVATASCIVTSTADDPGSRKVAGFGEIDADDSSGDGSERNSGVVSPEDGSACDDDDAGSVHSSGSDARHELDYLLE